MTRLILAIIFAILLPATAMAQNTPWVASPSEPVQQSLADLLNDGWQTTAGFGLGFTLIKDGKYILCEWQPNKGDRSRCYRLN